MGIDRKILRSIGEWSVFKYLLIGYLIFFVLSLIVFGVISLVVWVGLSSSGVNIQDWLGYFGVKLPYIPGRVTLSIAMFVAGGLIVSIFYAAVGTLVLWIMNVVLRITGGIELRFAEAKSSKETEES